MTAVEIVQVDWSSFKELGGLGVSAIAIYFGYRMVVLFIDQWRVSTEALNRNTDSFKKLSEVFETQSTLEREFQKEVLRIIHDSHEIVADTSRKVTRIYDKIVVEEEKKK